MKGGCLMTSNPILVAAYLKNQPVQLVPKVNVIIDNSEVPRPILAALGYAGTFRKASPKLKGTCET